MTDKYITTCCKHIFYGLNHSPASFSFVGLCCRCTKVYGHSKIKSESQLKRLKIQTEQDEECPDDS